MPRAYTSDATIVMTVALCQQVEAPTAIDCNITV